MFSAEHLWNIRVGLPALSRRSRNQPASHAKIRPKEGAQGLLDHALPLPLGLICGVARRHGRALPDRFANAVILSQRQIQIQNHAIKSEPELPGPGLSRDFRWLRTSDVICPQGARRCVC